MNNELIISKILNVIDYYIDNYRCDIETEWNYGPEDCVGFIISSKKGYKIITHRQQGHESTSFTIEILDRYGHKENYLSDNEIFCKFIDNSINRILNDNEVGVLERLEKENREINASKIIDG